MDNLNALEKARDVFAIFHDGEISAYCGNMQKLNLTIDCQYLAERINQSYTKFYVELINITSIYFKTWSNPISEPSNRFTRVEDIFKANLVILSSDIDNHEVKIMCNQHDLLYNYCGGELFISTENIMAYDEEMNELDIEELDDICNSYWEELNK